MKQYNGPLDANKAAAAMQAARLNALDLLTSAELLYQQGRYQHSAAISILAIEEIGKLPLIQGIFLADQSQLKSLWRAYRQHRAKTERLPIALESRIRVNFPEIDASDAREVVADGPSPAELDIQKQLALYSDFVEENDEPVCHLPRNVDWQRQAWERMWEAKVAVENIRDRTPEELGVWLRHRLAPENVGKALIEFLPAIHADLVKEGHIADGDWKYILQHLSEERGDA
ncbi:MAG: AbiV family abortive infection protein [Candidatus Competibacteraceae bacterium]|nr:AbiV family abortive infection protein [Candidatus Competibacteraceae bacterium]